MRKSKQGKTQTAAPDDKLEYFRKLILDHLDTLESGAMEKGAKMPVGTIREWKGKKFIKGPDGKWKPKYDSHTRGAKMAIAAIRRKIAAAQTPHDMMQIVLANRDRFSDSEGHPFPFVQELSKYVSERQDYLPENMEARRKEARSNAIKAGQKRAREKKEEAKKAAEENIRQKAERIKRQEEEREKASGEKSVEGWEQTGAADFKAGKPRKPPYQDIVKPGQKIGSPESKESNKKMEAWLRGWDKANSASNVTGMEEPGGEKDKSKNEWKNPLEGLGVDTPPAMIALTASHLFKEKSREQVRNGRQRREDVYIEHYGWSKEAAKTFEDYLEQMTSKEAKKAEKYGNDNSSEEEFERYHSEIMNRYIENKEKKQEAGEKPENREVNRRFSLDELNEGWKDGVFSMKEVADNLNDGDVFQGFSAETWKAANSNEEEYRAGKITAKELDERQDKLFSEENKTEESEEEKRRNRSEAMKGNKNAYKGGPKPQPEAERKAEEEEITGARKAAGLPPEEKHGRTSSMKDSTWDPKSKDYRYRDTGYIAGSRKEQAQTFIKRQAKEGTQVTNEAIDWTGIEENEVAAADIITKQNLMGKPDWGALQAGGLTGSAAFLINEIFKTINSKPERASAENRYNFSRGLDAIRSRFETCKTLEEVIEVAGEIQGEITGYYIESRRTPEYLKVAEKRDQLKKKITDFQEKYKEEIYKQGDPYAAADKYIKNQMGILSGIKKLIDPVTGKWNRNYYRGGGQLLGLLRTADFEFERRQREIEEKNGVSIREMQSHMREIEQELDVIAVVKNKELRLTNTMNSVWETFGKSFKKAINVTAVQGRVNFTDSMSLRRGLDSETFSKHFHNALGMKDDDFSWTEKKSTGGGKAGPRKAQFELLVADKIVRKGGRDVKIESTESLKNLFNLRDVQSGNWVLNDVKSAKFHVENIGLALSDLADITGIPDNLVSLNGRLAIALGARGHSKALAHYEPVERVINITKMKGGGCAGHEWWHAFDNLIADAMTGGRYNMFLSEAGNQNNLNDKQKKLLRDFIGEKEYLEKYPDSSLHKQWYKQAKEKAIKAGIKVDEIEASETHITRVKDAFSSLAKAIMGGEATRTENISYTKEDYDFVHSGDTAKKLMIKEGTTFEEAIANLKDVGSLIFRSRYSTHNLEGKGKTLEQRKRLIAAYFGKEPDGGSMALQTKEKTSHYFEASKKLDVNPDKPYWSDIKELGARAFAAYLNDKMAERGWENNYLSHATENSDYGEGTKPYPEGEERKAINAAFDELFRVVNESGAIRKAIDLENAWRATPGREAVIEEAVNGALKFFNRLRHGKGRFEKKKVVLNRAAGDQEVYRWTAEDEPKATAGRFITEEELRGLAQGQRQKTIAIDFDGVINSYTSGWKGPTETDDPVSSAAESISSLFVQGYKLIIFSTRANTPEGADTIREYLRNHTKNGMLADSIEITDRKPIADIYIDDRAIPFTGNWEETLEKIETFEPWVGKSLTYSGYPLQGRTTVQGMDISIENKKGNTRSGSDKDGHEWHTLMHFDYGYIRGTVGVDKDHLDAYIGPNPESEIVYIVNQNDPVSGKFDEQKVMLGFNSEAEAKEAYMKQYDRPGFFDSILKMDIDTFKDMAFDVKNKGKPLTKIAA